MVKGIVENVTASEFILSAGPICRRGHRSRQVATGIDSMNKVKIDVVFGLLSLEEAWLELWVVVLELGYG